MSIVSQRGIWWRDSPVQMTLKCEEQMGAGAMSCRFDLSYSLRNFSQHVLLIFSCFLSFFLFLVVAMSCVFVFLQCRSISQYWRMERWHTTYRSRKVRPVTYPVCTHALSAHSLSLFTSSSLAVALTVQ